MSKDKQITLQQKIDLLGQIEFFSNIEKDFHKNIASHLGTKRFAAEEYIFKEGDVGSELFLVYEGSLQIVSKEVILATLKAGDIFGEMAVMSRHSNLRTASAVAVSESTILFLKSEALYKLVHDTPDLALGLLDIVAQRLKVTTAKLRGDNPSELAKAEIKEIKPKKPIDPSYKRCSKCYEYNPPRNRKCVYCGAYFKNKYAKILVTLACFFIVSAFVYLYRIAPLAKKPSLEENKKIPAVRVTKIKPENMQLDVRCYGRVIPTQSAKIVSEIVGRVVYLNQNLEPGEFIRKGECLLKIDDTDYQLALERLENKHEIVKADLARLEKKKEDTAKQIAFVKQHVDLAAKTAQNQKKLYSQQIASEDLWDQAQKEYLSLAASLAALETNHSSLSQEIVSTKLAIHDANLAIKEAHLNIKRTQLLCPFDARIKSKMVEMGDIANPTQALLVIEDYSTADIRATINRDYLARLFKDPKQIKSVFVKKTQLQATVFHSIGNIQYKWDGIIRRFEPISTDNYSIPIVIHIENAWSDNSKPPLEVGAFTEIVIHGHTIENAITIPRSSLREDYTIHLVKDNRLHIRQIKVIDFIKDKAILEKGTLEIGDYVITNALLYPVEGTLLNPIEE